MLAGRISRLLAAATVGAACGSSSTGNLHPAGTSTGTNAGTGTQTGGSTDTSVSTGNTIGGTDTNVNTGTSVTTGTGPTSPFAFTSAPGAYWQPATVTSMASGNATLTVNDSTTYQTITGFGGAFNERGWQYLQVLSSADQAIALKYLFDPTDGANFQYGRIPIGSSDYAISRYTDDETSGDTMMSSFSITQDQKYLIPYVKAALAINPKIHLWGSAWTPPTWMKTGPYQTSSPFDGGNMKGDAQTLQAYALYLAKWVQAYAGQGITVEMLVPQNEPSYAEGYPSCLWSPSTFSTFVGKYLGPQFTSMNMSTQIFLGTMSKTSSPGDTDIMAAVLADSAAKGYVKGFGLQWTMQGGGSLNFSGDSSVASAVSSSGLPIWQTEHEAGNYPWGAGFNMSKAPNDYACATVGSGCQPPGYAIESWGLIRDWLKAGANSYSAWNMILDTGGLGNDTTRTWPQDSLLVVDTIAKTLTASPAYYVLRHFSQYIQPGATRVATSGGSVDSLAFKNPDGSIVTVIHNAGSSAAQTILAVGNAKLQFSVPANGFATVVK
jgi:glucosylceramidase